MKNQNSSDWKRVNQYRREQQQRIAAQKTPAPALLSANSQLLRLARELNTRAGDDAERNSEPAEFKVY
ncbi:hypothetical protein HX773_24945 [Pantoea sp. B9002]|uniref:hypothetical protein n=1 Tax=Pantoea sp. B9002 TaxID=2726979 RepID=UPI0015A1F2DE|nr:hypothetical protein [Pantoea sp. B9002]NWA64148.1 hypothetical protein [Pantoea sp. B9002]